MTIKTKLLLSGLICLLMSMAVTAVVYATTTEEPDEDCLYDTSLPKCTPGPKGCPEEFGTSDNGQCFPLHDKCPSGYHSHEDDESGECISDDIPCEEGYIMNLSFPSCERKEFVSQGKGN